MWYTHGKTEPPKRCASCKRPNWNKEAGVSREEIVRPEAPVRAVSRKVEAVLEDPDELLSPEPSAPIVSVDWYKKNLPSPPRYEDSDETQMDIISRVLAHDERYWPAVIEEQTEPLEAWVWRMYRHPRQVTPQMVDSVREMYDRYLPEVS